MEPQDNEELWRDIRGYEGHYQISNMGRVRGTGKWSTNQPTKWKILSQSGSGWGRYRRVRLYQDNDVTMHHARDAGLSPQIGNIYELNKKLGRKGFV